MKRGPQAGSAAGNQTFIEKAQAIFGLDLPDWIEALAATADARGLAGAGKAIDYSGSLVSSVLSGKYQGDLDRVEQKVRGALLGAEVDCPRLGAMSRSTCLEWQKKPFASTSSLRVEMFQACRAGCPNSRIKGGGDGTV